MEDDLRFQKSNSNFIERFWGGYVSIERGGGYQVKRLTLKPGKRISLQKHLHRSEHWVVVSGVAKIVLGGESIVLGKNESTYVGVGVVHRLENMGKIDLEIIEVQMGEYLGEDDIERFEDDFGRVDGEDLSTDYMGGHGFESEVDLVSEEFCIGEGCGEE
ncbi:phosphomannose isomerase type II C-terminal cupin domain [archaeon]|jgi:mannose-1-phosphate guanylyltransferase / mannose-6-phosphate isomerase|nr:phosphomannose isomerase type II C-terminal cupin domain [archaeon]MBT7128208.1 phosphomannose isomerase type II C-terminal cupin domain [archaeon]